MIFSPKRPRPHQQEKERNHVGKPRFDAAADVGTEVDLGELFARADDESADDRAGDRLEAARISTGSAFSAVNVSAYCTPLRTPTSGRRRAPRIRRPPTRSPRYAAAGCRRRALPDVVRHARSAADARLLEQHGEHGHQHARHEAAKRSNWLMLMFISPKPFDRQSGMPSSRPCGWSPNSCDSPRART